MKEKKLRKGQLFQKLAEKLESGKSAVLLWIGISFALNILIELLSRRSLISLLKYIVLSPLVFLYNGLLIMATMSLMFLFRRRVFTMLLLSVLWIAIGVTDFAVLFARTTPFTAQDLLLIEYGLRLVTDYIPLFILILGIIVILLIFMFLFWLWYAGAICKKKVSYIASGCFVMSCFFVALLMTRFGNETGILATRFANIAEAYHTYGLPYCFANTLLNTGISRPDGYGDDVIDQILEGLNSTEAPTPSYPHSEQSPEASVSSPETNEGRLPEESSVEEPVTEPDIVLPEDVNVIVIQLESFFDITKLDNISFDQDPISYFHQLMENYSSGYVSVPSIGAGTANTEFEMITGMNLDSFGPGEYPYKTILKKKASESFPYILKDNGYTAHAIHNNDGTFYDRNTVFSNLGFDTFTSIEYMKGLTYTETGWAEDQVLLTYIMEALESTDTPDFVYAISVQGHGAYPETDVIEHPQIRITDIDDAILDYYYGYLYYINQLREMDMFIETLTRTLSQYEEKCILVLFGDHLPGFDIQQENLQGNDLFQTPYVIWNNFGLEKQDRNLQAYQLLAYALSSIGVSDGILCKYHQQYLSMTERDEEEYLKQLEILEFDILYGDQLVYEGNSPYAPTNLHMGLKDIRIEGVTSRENVLFVMGENFTPYSIIYVDGKALETVYLTEHSLLALEYEPKDIQSVVIAQTGVDHVVLSYTEEYVYDYLQDSAFIDIVRPSVEEDY